MALTDREKKKLTAYRERMYKAGFKQVQLWVPRNSEGKDIKMERRAFLGKIEELTAGWNRRKLSKLFGELINIVRRKLKEEK